MPASPNVGNYRFPFKHIPDISGEASRQIRRNFEAVCNTLAASEFDAIIDPASPTNEPGGHLYKNLTALVATEVWLPGSTFIVGVKQRFGTQIVEPVSPLSIAGKGHLVLFGLSPIQPTAAAAPYGWDWATLACDATQQVWYYNLTFSPTSAGT